MASIATNKKERATRVAETVASALRTGAVVVGVVGELDVIATAEKAEIKGETTADFMVNIFC